MPYHPIRPPEKPVSHEKMLDILAKRTNGVLPTCESTQPLQFLPHVQPLEWDKPVLTGIEAGTKSGYQRSTDKRYSVTRDISGDSVSYSAWRLLTDLERHGKPWKQMAEHLGVYEAGGAAKAACAADAALHA